MTSLFVIGVARSGKSRYAQTCAETLGLAQVYVATAQAFDDEMRERIARHWGDRGESWETVEAPLDIAAVIRERSDPGTVLLVDCLTLWTTNLILGEHDVAAATGDLVEALQAARGPTILVANETGLGIVPDNALARRFRDEAGVVNQRIATMADEVQCLFAGLPMRLK